MTVRSCALPGGLSTTVFTGAKHHAMADHSSGFCVFNDFAMVAKHLLTTSATVQRIAVRTSTLTTETALRPS
ncbi:MAG: hypothetical protein GY911_00730 [Actinomycetales bacterium]|nr:hypothetical protein [Actinomycetales bacterium]